MDPVAIGFATTAATLLVTVLLFTINRVITRGAERRESQRKLIGRVLDALELSTRSISRPAVVLAWTNPDIEYVLLLPRILLELPRKHRVIAVWIQRQAQLMQLEPSRKNALRLRVSVAEKLLQWHHAELEIGWFEKQVRHDPPIRDFRVPASIRLKKYARDSWAWTQLLAVLAALAFVVKQAQGVSRVAHRSE